MSNAYILKKTPFSVDYDLPREINSARKLLWSESKAIKSARPGAKCKIVYPAKLIVDGKLVRDEFPDWSVVLRGNRLGDFSHIDNFLISRETECDQQTIEDMEVNVRSDTDTGVFTQDLFDSPVSRHSHSLSSAQNDSQKDNTDMVQSKQSPIRVCSNLPSESVTSSGSATEKNTTPLNPFFRPFNTPNITTENLSRNSCSNSDFPGRGEHASRSMQRGTRRNLSLSLPRNNPGTSQGTSTLGNQNINSRNGDKNSLPRENQFQKDTKASNGSKNRQYVENSDQIKQTTSVTDKSC